MKHELMITAETRVTLGVSEANRLHRYAQAQAEMAACAGRNAVTAGLKLGKLLTELKAATPHGEWGEFFAKDDKLKPRFQFTQQMSNRYMRCYKTAAGRLANTERYLLDAGLSGEPVSELPTLVDKVTDGAETDRKSVV